MKSHLKVKVFSHSAEMTFIRRNELKWKNKARAARQRQAAHAEEKHVAAMMYAELNFWSLRRHRNKMKLEARTTHLAYGFMKGRSYAQMENICYGGIKGFGSSEPDWAAIEATVLRFSKDEVSPQHWMQVYAEWLTEAKAWYEGNPSRIASFKTNRDAMRVQQANDPVYQQAKLERHMTAMAIGIAIAKAIDGMEPLATVS